jgi:hypothetical protein
MAFSDYHRLADVLKKFKIEPIDHPDLFAGVADVQPSAFVTASLHHGLPLATAIGTEKARSEMIVVPLLLDLKIHAPDISLFSGVELSVDPEAGLTGVCDFLVSRTPEQHVVRAPIVTLVEAKNENLREGMAQCLAEMIAAQIFNQREGNDVVTVYGAVTTGSVWKFMSLSGQTVTLDPEEYLISRPEQILGILIQMAKG